MCAESKILTGLVERRALEAAIGELAAVSDPAGVAERAESIAQHGDAALAALLAALDTADPQLRGGLGQVALRLPREQVMAALRGAARGQARSAQARLTALTLLERFFDEPPDEALLAGLQSPDQIALQSLGELVQTMTQDPAAILEYLAQLGSQPPDVQQMILQAVPAAPPSPHLLTLLRMLAQDPDPGLAGEALAQLGRTPTPGAARALMALAETLPPPLAALAGRGLRKLRLRGIAPVGGDLEDAPWYAPDRRWRVLISPADDAGAQLVWFIGQAPASERAMAISFLCEEAGGLTFAAGALAVAAADLPPVQPIGSLHRLTVGEPGAQLLLLEASLEEGLRILRKALAVNWQSGAPTPPAYRLLNLPIWLAAPEGDRTPSGDSPGEKRVDSVI